MNMYVFMFPLSLPVFFLLARFGHKTDGRILFCSMFLSFLCIFLSIGKSLVIVL
jgi:hypothetical protein